MQIFAHHRSRGALLAHLRLAHLCTVIHRLVHLCTVISRALIAQIPFATSVSKVHCQVLDSDITATDLNAAAAVCVFGDEITPLCEVREYTLRNLVSRQRGQLKNLTFFPGPSTRKRQHSVDCFPFSDDNCSSIVVLHEMVYDPSLEDPTLTLLECLLHFNDYFVISTKAQQ